MKPGDIVVRGEFLGIVCSQNGTDEFRLVALLRDNPDGFHLVSLSTDTESYTTPSQCKVIGHLDGGALRKLLEEEFLSGKKKI